MRLKNLFLLLALFPVLAWSQGLERQPAPENARVYFINPADGETVSGPVRVRFGLKGMGVAPAGVKFENTGHHHLLINVPAEEMPRMVRPLPATEGVRHFGGGETETVLKLPPGEHTLQLVFGDYLHIPHNPPVKSKRISITVKKAPQMDTD